MRTRLERETVIVYNELEDTARVWSASDKVIRKLIKMGYKSIDSTKDSKTFEIPKKLISIRKGNKKYTMSAEQRAKVAERLVNARTIKAS